MISDFIQYLIAVKGYSNNTAEAYRQDLTTFVKYAQGIDPHIRWSKITAAFIQSFTIEQHRRGYAIATICRQVSSIRSYYDYARTRGLIDHNPARYVQSPKRPKPLPHTLEKEAITATLIDPKVSQRTKLQIALLSETGIRLQEMLDIQAADIDTQQRQIRVTGKGKKTRIVYYGAWSAKWIEPYLQGRIGTLFTDTQREVRANIFHAMRPHTNRHYISPHILRHTYATEMLNNGASLKAISALLGHESASTTEIYAQIANPKVRAEYQQHAPKF